MLQGFKEFISRGNAIDLAVGVVIGAAFTKIIDALVEKVLNPLIGGLFGQPNFDTVGQFTLGSGPDQATVQPGAILTALISFLLVAAALYFVVVLPMNKLAERRAKGEEPAAEEKAEDTLLLTEIRDLLATRPGGTTIHNN